MRIQEVQFYQFDELNDSAKEKALNQLRERHEYGWVSENRDSLDYFLGVFNLTLRDFEYGTYRNPYIRVYYNKWEDDVLELSGVRAATYLWNNFKWVLLQPKVYYKNGKRRKSNIYFDVNCPTGYCMDYSLYESILNSIKNPGNNTVQEMIQEALDCWVRDCSNDYEESYSDSYITEHYKYNAEFYEDGTIYY